MNMARRELKRRMKGFLMFLPNLVALSGRLMVDSRVPRTERVLLAGAIVYALIPLDVIPDFIPFVGQVDDVYLVSLTLLRLLNRTDDMVIREHWRGGGDVVQLIRSVAELAPRFLPGRVRRVLDARVEAKPNGATEAFLLIANQEPVLIEVAGEGESDS
jgi:uncharacterized membrane protein YkvA (DUF1232 family)